MKYFLPCLDIILTIVVISTADDPFKLTSVSPQGVKNLYRRIRKGISKVVAPPILEFDTKNKICQHITSAAFFDRELREVGVYTHEIYDRLKNRDSDIDVTGIFDANISLDDIVHTNPTTLVDVFTSEDDEESIKEYVFACLTVDVSYSSDVVFIYLISPEYNLSDTPDKHIAGRFIMYTRESRDSKIIAFAIAEEPAKPLSTTGVEVERMFLEKNGKYMPEENQSDDPICKLDRDQRLRVCTMVLNSMTHFEGEFKFIPSYDYMDETRCVKRRITSENEETRDALLTKLAQWMISCRAVYRDTQLQAEFFLSRVYDSANEVFVYRRILNHYMGVDIVLVNLFGNVRFKI